MGNGKSSGGAVCAPCKNGVDCNKVVIPVCPPRDTETGDSDSNDALIFNNCRDAGDPLNDTLLAFPADDPQKGWILESDKVFAGDAASPKSFKSETPEAAEKLLSPASPSPAVQTEPVAASAQAVEFLTTLPQKNGIREVVSVEDLCRESTETLDAIITMYEGNPMFAHFAHQSVDVKARHDERIAKGIAYAMSKDLLVRCTLGSNFVMYDAKKLDVLSQSPEEVALYIIESLSNDGGVDHGQVIALTGSRGSGKGAVRRKLQEKLPKLLAQTGEGEVSHLHHWRIGTLFRAITLLATTYRDQHRCTLLEACHPNLMDMYTDIIELENFEWQIQGMGMRLNLLEIENTLLKAPEISSSVAEVAENCQGYVIIMVTQNLRKMADANMTLLLEGYASTLAFVNSHHKFEFCVDDSAVLGQWHAAQTLARRSVRSRTAFGSMSLTAKEALERAVGCLEITAPSKEPPRHRFGLDIE